jgi:hypothetical protein
MADAIARNHARIGGWQTQMPVKALRRAPVRLYTTGLQPSDLVDTFTNSSSWARVPTLKIRAG